MRNIETLKDGTKVVIKYFSQKEFLKRYVLTSL